MNVSKLLTENSDAVFKINKPGEAQFFELQNNVKSMGLKNKGYFVVSGFDKTEFETFMKKEVPNDNNIVFLFTESYSDDKNVNDVKEAVSMVKDAGMQAVVVVNTHNAKPGVPSSEISYFNSQSELFTGLENMFDMKLSVKDDASKNIGNVMSKLSSPNKDGKKNNLR